MKMTLLTNFCAIALLGALLGATVCAEDQMLTDARKVVTALLDQEERWLSGDTGFSIDDVLSHYASDVVKVSSGKTHVGLGAVKKWWVSNVQEYQKFTENGLKIDTKAKIETVQQLTESSVLVTVKETQFITKGTDTTRSEYIGLYVLAREGSLFKVKLETTNE